MKKISFKAQKGAQRFY